MSKATLTKSLHTVTAVTNVARELARFSGGRTGTAKDLTDRALQVLGYVPGTDFPKSDETYLRCVASVGKVLS